jgi:ABC-type transport system substrate-binding protein
VADRPGGPTAGAEPAVPEFALAAAARLLDEAGWTDSEPKDGIRDHAGKQSGVVIDVRTAARSWLDKRVTDTRGPLSAS